METTLNTEKATDKDKVTEMPNGISIRAIARTVPAVAIVVGMVLMLVGDPIIRERGWTLIQYGVGLQVLYLVLEYLKESK